MFPFIDFLIKFEENQFSHYLMFFFLLSNAFMTLGPVELGLCTANINGSVWDLLPGFKNEKFTFTEGDYTYFMKLCSPLTHEDLPNDAPVQLTEANIMRVHNTYRGYQDMAHLTAFEFKPMSATNFDLGIIYHADGEPALQVGKWISFDFRNEILCDPSKTGVPSFSVHVLNVSNAFLVRSIFSHASGCRRIENPPTPTPEFSPDCHFVSRWKFMNTSGIDAHLDEINGGPYGIRFPIKFMGRESLLFYQPCGRMKCPLTFHCSNPNEYSSTWICPRLSSSGDLCENFGVTTDDIDIELAGQDEREGLLITQHNGQTKTVLHLTCTTNFPDGHINFTEEVNYDSNTVSLFGKSSEVCIVNIPDPQPPIGGQCSFTKESYGSVLSIGLKTLNKDPNGWVQNVQVKGLIGGAPGTLIYQPCGALRCPEGSFCDGDDGATVWLCRDVSGRNECDGYGLLEHNVSISLIQPMIMQQGLRVRYSGDNKYLALVNYICDKNLEAGVLGLPDTVYLDGLTLKYNVTASSACVDTGSHTPEPTAAPWYVPTPKPYPSPVPTPLASPNPINLYHNDTHFILVDLLDVVQNPQRGDTNVVSRFGSMPVHYEFSPWEILRCPNGWECDPDDMESNFYLCWTNERSEKKCHSYAHRAYDAVLKPINKNNLDLGGILRYNSQRNTDLEMRITCQLGSPKDWITILPSSPFSYSSGGLASEEISVVAQSGGVCPQQFFVPQPPATPDPTPSPSNTPINFYFRSETQPGKVFVEIDLIKIRPHLEPIVLGYGSKFERAIVSIDADLARPCPAGYECLGGGTSNIWKCHQPNNSRPYCYGIGDARWLLHIDMAGSSLYDGVVATYGGGYSGYQTTMHFLCNPDIPEDEVDLDDVGYETSMHTVHIFAHTSMVCPKKKGPTPLPTLPPGPQPTQSPQPTLIPIPSNNSSTFGGIFLFTLISGSILYLTFGIFIIFITTGTFNLPNESFWDEFRECLLTGLAFVISCGKSTTLGAASYDTI